jgi:hypothetical protein
VVEVEEEEEVVVVVVEEEVEEAEAEAEEEVVVEEEVVEEEEEVVEEEEEEEDVEEEGMPRALRISRHDPSSPIQVNWNPVQVGRCRSQRLPHDTKELKQECRDKMAKLLSKGEEFADSN